MWDGCLLAQKDYHTVTNDANKPLVLQLLTATEFARLSSSMQLTLLAIRRAQLSSRKTIAMATERMRRHASY